MVGTTEEIEDPAERARAEALELQPWAGEVRDRYVRIRRERGDRAPDQPGVTPGKENSWRPTAYETRREHPIAYPLVRCPACGSHRLDPVVEEKVQAVHFLVPRLRSVLERRVGLRAAGRAGRVPRLPGTRAVPTRDTRRTPSDACSQLAASDRRAVRAPVGTIAAGQHLAHEAPMALRRGRGATPSRRGRRRAPGGFADGVRRRRRLASRTARSDGSASTLLDTRIMNSRSNASASSTGLSANGGSSDGSITCSTITSGIGRLPSRSNSAAERVALTVSLDRDEHAAQRPIGRVRVARPRRAGRATARGRARRDRPATPAGDRALR